MNLAETHDLLTLIAAYDNRRFDDATVLAWHPILASATFEDCRTAVTRHFATSTEYLMPAHVNRGAIEIRNRRATQRETLDRLAIEQDPERRDRTEATKDLIRRLRDSLPDGDPDKLRRPEWVEWDKRRAREATAEQNPLYDPTVHARLAEET